MKFLLKIVQGPNAGAEIALVEGVRVTLGSADSCDIVLADPTLAAEACAIEASADSVAISVPGSEPENLAPLQVRSFGSTALAVGPADSPWGPLVWEAPAGGDAAKTDGEKADTPPPPPAAESTAKPADEVAAEPDAAEGSEDKPHRSLARRLGGLVLLLLLLLLLAAWLLARRGASPDGPAPSGPTTAPAEDAAAIAERYGLALVETNGTTLVRGDFATRAERLEATAALYEAQPGIALDLADRETLLSSSADLLQAATEGAMKIADITNRVAVLAGRAPDPAFLRATVEALRTDVPRLAGADTAAVVLDSPVASTRAPAGIPARPSRGAPILPLCGVVLQPYPYLVLQNGQRLAVGAEVGGYKIERIARDRITLRRGEEEPLEWTP